MKITHYKLSEATQGKPNEEIFLFIGIILYDFCCKWCCWYHCVQDEGKKVPENIESLMNQ